MKLKKKWIIGGTSLLLVLGGIGWAAWGQGEGETIFTVESATRKDLKESVNANGEIQAKTRVNVGTSVTGEIKEIHVKDGQWVKTGDLLVTVDQERFRQQLTQADLSLRGARQDLQNAQATFDKQHLTFQRNESLFRQGLVSAEEFQAQKLARETSQNQLERARVSVSQAQAQVALAQDSLSKTVLRASMSGRVTGLKAEKGETAIAGQTNIAGAVLMVISDMSEMLAEVKVGELDVVKLKVGQPAEIQVDAIPGKVFQGKVLEVATSVERASQGGMSSQDAQNYRVRILLQSDADELESLRPGMSARVAVLSQEVKQALTIPLQAIQDRESKKGGLGLMTGTQPIVYAVKNGVVEERQIKAGVMTRQALQVIEGVKEGESVIIGPTKALSGLSTGANIKTQSEEEAIKARRK